MARANMAGAGANFPYGRLLLGLLLTAACASSAPPASFAGVAGAGTLQGPVAAAAGSAAARAGGSAPIGMASGGSSAPARAGGSAPVTAAGTSAPDTGQAGTLAQASAGAHAEPASPSADGCTASAFALSDVTLEQSDFTANRDRTLGYLRAIDLESLLYNFRTTVGLSTNKATPPTSWEAPDSNLRGHATGHVLKALAQAYAGTQDAQLKTKADTLVSELKKCQDLAEAKSFGAGYLGAYPPDQFIKLESLTQYPTIWAPYYTMHKLLAGLVASYQLTGNATALEMAQKLALWAHARLSKLPRSKLQDMWNLYIAGEAGGMNEVLAELYQITNNQTFLEAATLFDKDLVLDSCAAHEDKLGGLHANQHIPTITGYLRVYEGNHTDKYRSAAQNFWSMVTEKHMYVIGGTGDAEMWKPAGQIGGALTTKTCETCATYNMLKLTRQLFCHDPDARYMDYYERGLFNHILGSQDPTSKNNAAVTYFVPLNPGAQRTYNNTYTCCHGTGMENHTKYQEQIYSRAGTDLLYVNLYIASTLQWKERGFSVAQTTRYPYEPSSKLTLTGSGPLRVSLRIPGWAEQGAKILVNGMEQSVETKPGTYAVIDRTWASGDTLEIRFSFGFRVEKTPDDASLGAILYGPSVLVATSNKTTTLPAPAKESELGSAFMPKDPAALTFTAGDLTFEPFNKATNTAYHTYFKF